MTLSEYRALLRHHLLSFIVRSFYELNPEGSLVLAPYIELIAAKLEACRLGKIKRLIISVPPRSLKSIMASVAFPAYVLGHDPAKKIICASYGQDLADKFARDTRTLMNSPLYRATFRTRLPNRQAVNDIVTPEHGGRMATSVGGVLTGRGADFIILDDLLKPDEALSETRRAAVNEWYSNSLVSRLDDKASGCIIIIMQRLHQDDLVGHVLSLGGDWEVVSLPAIAEVDESLVIQDILDGAGLMNRICQT